MFNASIVLYRPDLQQLQHVVQQLLQVKGLSTIYLIDNSPTPLAEISFSSKKVDYIYTGKNRGYGAGNNIALRKTIEEDIPFHLVLNADVTFSPTDIWRMFDYMEQHPEIGSMMPKVVYPDGEIQYLCKLLPTPFDLFCRRFLPDSWIKWQSRRFCLRFTGYNSIMNVPYLSGCFMLLNTEALRQVGIFDERFFMYPEDIDLTRRLHRKYQTLFFPEVTIVHYHEKASYKNKKLLWVHIVNICKYFNKYGWFFDKERRQVNRATLLAVGK